MINFKNIFYIFIKILIKMINNILLIYIQILALFKLEFVI